MRVILCLHIVINQSLSLLLLLLSCVLYHCPQQFCGVGDERVRGRREKESKEGRTTHIDTQRDTGEEKENKEREERYIHS